VRSPPRASSTASAVPKDPAPITVARLPPGGYKERAREARVAGLGGAAGPGDAAWFMSVTGAGGGP
jgi:hypothetical protein